MRDFIDPTAAEDFVGLVEDGGLAGGEGELGLVEDDGGAFPIVGNADGGGGAVAAVARAHFAVKLAECNAKLDSNKDCFPGFSELYFSAHYGRDDRNEPCCDIETAYRKRRGGL